ncbi:13708_t:CDS:2, partial [Dentiscutata erythropus]
SILVQTTLSYEIFAYNGIINEGRNLTDPSDDFPHIYALTKFKVKSKKYRKIWDEENHPLFILDQKKEEYSNIINARLRHESTLVSEAYIRWVKKIPWLTCTETVRLKYFEELAIEVQNGYKENALNHFKNPKQHIESWFKFTVDIVVDENPEHIYNDTFRDEIGQIYRKICGCHHENNDDSKIYYNNYQLRGFRGTRDQEMNELVPIVCHRIPNNYEVWYLGKGDSTKWGTVKDKDFSNWKFEPHYKYMFNDLMYWSFEKLHEDLANFYVCEPTSQQLRKLWLFKSRI